MLRDLRRRPDGLGCCSRAVAPMSTLGVFVGPNALDQKRASLPSLEGDSLSRLLNLIVVRYSWLRQNYGFKLPVSEALAIE